MTLPHELVAKSKYNFKIKLKNDGQGWWNEDYVIQANNNSTVNYEIKPGIIKDINPNEERLIEFIMTTNNQQNNLSTKFTLIKNNKTITESEPWQFDILPLPSLTFNIKYFPWGKGQGEFEIQIFNTEDQLVYKQSRVKVNNKGTGQIFEVPNIALDDLYRVVVIKPGYLPRQNYIVFKKANNMINFKRLLPFDINHDGKFDWNDVLKIFNKNN